MKIFTDQERKIVIVLAIFLLLGVLVNIVKENIFTDSSENLKLIAVSEEINSIYDNASTITDTTGSINSVINVNTADSIGLSELPGIGPALASRIISQRQQSGYFKSPEDLLKVKGIGEKVLTKLLPFITF